MKNFIYILISILLVFTSCDKDDGDTYITINNPPPTGHQTPRPYGQYRLDSLTRSDSNYVSFYNYNLSGISNPDSTDYIYFNVSGEFIKGVRIFPTICSQTIEGVYSHQLTATVALYDTTLYDTTANSIMVLYPLYSNDIFIFHYSKSNYAPADTVTCN